jgi:membrane-bound metal-dependent hydrolase YbcI (DUF457 family)
MFNLAGIKPRKAFLLAFISLIPDFDLLFGVHRSISHSVFVWFAGLAPLMIYFWRYEPEHLRDVLLVFFSGSLHCLFDSFSSYAPVLWPFTLNNLKIDFSLFVHMDKRILLEPLIGVSSIPTDFKTIGGFDAPVFTSEAFVTSLALLAPVALKTLNECKETWINQSWIPRQLLSIFDYVFHMVNKKPEK